MGRTSRKRSTLAGRAIAAATALILGGGGLAVVNVYASAGESSGREGPGTGAGQPAAVMSTIDCPDVGDELREVPQAARQEVDAQLAALDSQITEAYTQLAQRQQTGEDPAGLFPPLEQQRRASIGGIVGAIEENGGAAPENLDSLAPCTLRATDQDPEPQPDPDTDTDPDPDPDPDTDTDRDMGTGTGTGTDTGTGTGTGTAPDTARNQGGQAGNGPVADDFVDIRSVEPNVNLPRAQQNASRGTFTTDCGTNENGNRNPDNVIVAPGVSNGAHHMHDYVGNQANNAFADDEDLANGATSCRNQGDRSTYYWPVLRVQNGQDEEDAGADGGGNDQNVGEIQTPVQVSLTFEGSPVGEVTAMPRFLRIITGDAKAFTNGDANANASWSCTGFEDRQLADKYPLCPDGSDVVRTFRFQSCWDGQNTDSANHRTHVAFTDEQGRCPQGFRAVPQLVQRIVYDVAPERNFAVDSFPEQLHKPITDHGDFINVFDEELMNRMVRCINRGDRCT
ncbi:DUF1996 domain-containing protein [Streptomyces sp. B-S-A8]|uniref:DUF1996 domain-containing protein n=1 Tax=Streptomyces solicavernae TaxID=3043614 RepID=A0ABT6RS28_9ACTN|nr:DUF1996 domain-containing protein [Streptomyces sp. B-S-A8]MDI3387246.1 DUF1996 domain-containing protein [Streptomyces sp. B-S-A8]